MPSDVFTLRDGLWRRPGESLSPATPVTGANFAGDPGAGNYYIGWAEGPGNSSLTQAQSNLGWPAGDKVSVWHQYNSTGFISATQADEAINAGMVASLTFKANTYTHTQITSGAADAAIDAAAAIVDARAPHPFWLCFNHEPEDDFTTSTTKANFRAASRYIVNRFRSLGVTENVTWVPIYMCPYTFSNSSGRDWKDWHPDWDGSGWHGDLTMDAMGHDFYMPQIGSSNMYSFEYFWEVMKGKVEVAGAPSWDYLVFEFGMKAYGTQAPSPLPNWLTWAQDARTYIEGQGNIKSLCYWDNSTDTGRYSFGPTYDPNGTKIQGWNHLIDGSVRWGA